jgi:uncharacterized membrane protein
MLFQAHINVDVTFKATAYIWRLKRISLYTMTLLYILAGANHLIHPEIYRKIMPGWIPLHEAVIFISGLCEILFAFFLLWPATRRLSAWLLIALLIAVFPANVQMMLNYLQEKNPGLWLTVLRLPLQIVLVCWAYSFTKQPSLE